MKPDDAQLGQMWEFFGAIERFVGHYGQWSDNLRMLRWLVEAGAHYTREGGRFKEGDQVRLTRTIDADKDGGWYRFRHFLVKGSTGVVRNKELRGGGPQFEPWRHVYTVVFDGDGEGDRSLDRRGGFYMRESDLEPLGDP